MWAKLSELSEVDGADVVREIVGLFLQHAPDQLAAVRESVGQKDAAALERAAHTFKSSCADVGALPLSALCKELEAIGRAGSVAGATEQLSQIETEYDRVKQVLEAEHQAA